MLFKKRSLHTLLAVTLALPVPAMLFGAQAAYAENANDPAPVIAAKVVNENAGKKVLFDNSHGETSGAADWVIDGGFSDFGNALANAGFYVKELRKTTPITLADLQPYDVFVVAEAQFPFKPAEQQALLDYVNQGGSVFFVADHYNADRNKNRWDGSEVFNGYRRGAWSNPAKGMGVEEAASAAMQGVQSSDWLAQNFGVRFRYNALGDINATNIVAPDQAFGITTGVSAVAMHAGSTIAITDPTKAKGLVYLPKTNESWASAVDQGVYNGGGVAEGAFSAISKVGLGKAAFIGDSSPIEDASPKYLREENGKTKTTYDGWKEVDDAKYFTNLVNWLAKKESYTALNQVPGLQLDQPTQLLAMENPVTSTEPQAEPWAAPDAGYKWWDSSTYKPGSYGTTSVVNPPAGNPAYSTVHQAVLPNAQDFQVRVVADNLTPFATLSNFNLGIYLTGGTQIGQVQNADGTWPTAYGYSSSFSLTADSLGHATKDLTVRVKSGSTGAANLRFRQGSNALKTEAVTLGNVPAEPLPKDKPPVPATVSISAARAGGANQLVTVEGIVTTAPGAFGGQAFYMQDATGGVYVFQNTAGFQVGDKISISATTSLYNTELELSDPINIEKIGTADVPAPVVVPALNDQNQGQLVTLQAVTIKNIITAAPTGSFEFDAVNANGSTHVRVDARTGLTLSAFPFKEGQVVTLNGISAIFKGVYQLKPRGLSDFAIVDTTAPVTSMTVNATPKQSGWYNQDVEATLTATDDSGVDHIEYALTPDAWQTYTGPISFTTEGKNFFQVRAVDVYGNVEAPQDLVIDVDKTAPTVDAQADKAANENGWYNEDLKINMQAADGQSQIDRTEYRVNGGEWQVVNGNAYTLSVGDEGTTTVDVRSVDFAENVSDVKSVIVQIDRSAPTISLTQDGAAIHDVLADGKFSFNLNATDAVSGVKVQTLTLDDQGINSGVEFDASTLAIGVHTVRATAVDAAGNTTGVSYTFLISTDLNTVQNLLKKLAVNGEVKNGGIQQSLTAKLNTVQFFVAKGKPDQAAKQLQDLQGTLTNYANNGNVSKHAADLLNANLNYLLTHEIK
ncbi:endonuclease [Tumebacillus sp. ITR2]|uniref:Endonuclease n=1 Tax=Tumebacillus amylolyticus TaxID=2801339 RepID=A0ABS1J6X4_9BACL|nr:endonuclease [Tumebacillus amylolyticus]MBL0386009.1 endonuclease [Tumebacillus amylolyticus]